MARLIRIGIAVLVGNAASTTALSPAGWVAVAAVLVVTLVVVRLVVRRRRTARGARSW